jgi:putative hemolysin
MASSSLKVTSVRPAEAGSATALLSPTGAYALRFAETDAQRRSVFRLRFLVFNMELRFLVFNMELNEGLESAYENGEDRDAFDSVFDHLLVEHVPTGRVVGTYRMQNGATAARNLGYYSAREFDFTPYEGLRAQMIELGRACVHRDHRSFEVLTLLWRGIAMYAQQHGARYLAGCSSLTSQDPTEGSAMYHRLEDCLVTPELRTQPLPEFAFTLAPSGGSRPTPPKLLRSYLAVGAQICGPPALDREFKTIDFLTLLDLEALSPSVRARWLG